ncbi:MAG: hypothetical protein AAFY41_19545, partial [Bacteroidota bacterium]
LQPNFIRKKCQLFQQPRCQSSTAHLADRKDKATSQYQASILIKKEDLFCQSYLYQSGANHYLLNCSYYIYLIS